MRVFFGRGGGCPRPGLARPLKIAETEEALVPQTGRDHRRPGRRTAYCNRLALCGRAAAKSPRQAAGIA